MYMCIYTTDDIKLHLLSASLAVSPVKRRPGGVVNWKQLRNGGGRDAQQLAIIVVLYIYIYICILLDGGERVMEINARPRENNVSALYYI